MYFFTQGGSFKVRSDVVVVTAQGKIKGLHCTAESRIVLWQYFHLKNRETQPLLNTEPYIHQMWIYVSSSMSSVLLSSWSACWKYRTTASTQTHLEDFWNGSQELALSRYRWPRVTLLKNTRTVFTSLNNRWQ